MEKKARRQPSLILSVRIELGNDAFKENYLEEVERLLLDAASRLPYTPAKTNGKYTLHDANGNYCGEFSID